MGLALALTASILWGLNYVFAETVMRSLSPFTLTTLELLVAGVVALAVGLLRGHLRRRRARPAHELTFVLQGGT